MRHPTDTRLSAATHKGYPAWAPALPLAEVGQQGWHVLQADWPLPSAVLREPALQHNLGWMQRLVQQAGVELAPHGKTTLSPELFQAQLDAGAWGITFANVGQLAMGVAHGVRRALIANQVLLPHDLHWLASLHRAHPSLQTAFWLDSTEQLRAIEHAMGPATPQTTEPPSGQATDHAAPAAPRRPMDVLIELGLPGGRSGCRTQAQALALAQAAHASPAVRLVGIACYEGLWATGDTAADTALTHGLMQRLHQLAAHCDGQGLFADAPEIILTAGGSAVFDLVAPLLRPPQPLTRPVRPLLRSGCYLTHDHGTYQRFAAPMQHRLASSGLGGQPWGCGSGLEPALEVWAAVVSCPEPGLAILNAGKRDLSHDAGLPTPVRWCPAGEHPPQPCPADWAVTALNDQHAYLQLGNATATGPALRVGDRVALGISHPCTTFDKWRWMPVINDQGGVVDAIHTQFG